MNHRKGMVFCMAKKRRRIRSNDNRIGRLCISFILIAFMVVMTIQIKKVYQKDQAYMTRQAELEQQLKSEQERKDEIKEYQNYIESQEYIEDQATSKLGLLYKNQIIFREKGN